METAKRKKRAVKPAPEEGDVQVRVSSRTPHVQKTTPPVTRAQNLAMGLLEGIIGQVADYIENSHAVERLIRAQTSQVLRELAHDPQLTGLIRSQAEQYVAELTIHPEILEPLIREQVDRYLDHLAKNPERSQVLARKLKPPEPNSPAPRRKKPRTTKLEIE
jgi:hypothetical protein